MKLFLALLQAPVDDAQKSAAEETFKLFGAYSLADPWFLIMIPLALAAIVYGRMRFGRAKARVGSLATTAARRSLVQNLVWLPLVLQFAALTLVAIALARPLRGSVETRSESEGVDIALAIDISSSMEYNDLDPKKTRLQVVKEVVRAFAVRRMTDREGAADNIALLTFAHYPKLVCPFTLDVDAMTGFIDSLEIVKNRQAEDGTAIGVGLAKAVAVLKGTEAKSKVVVLLTDGENNVYTIRPEDAADLAAKEKIKVYTVFAGRFAFNGSIFTQRAEEVIDTSELEAIARLTGGRFFRAKDARELENVYAEIENLERTKRETRRFTETFDLYPRFLLIGLICYVLSWILSSTWARRLV
ncbi:MAG: VWA domain-containing protein [Planctomycetes bacterium]|nr:VWA domain-containing protein [Planctomycetota bacterium]